jgi:hypothetical protein
MYLFPNVEDLTSKRTRKAGGCESLDPPSRMVHQLAMFSIIGCLKLTESAPSPEGS